MTGTDDSPAFARARSEFDVVVGFLGGEAAAGLTHAELETELGARGRELLRQLYQDHLDLRAEREVRLPEVVGADGVARHYAEDGHRRPLATVFGQVTLGRIAYRRKGEANLHPADGALNLPTERHSHGLRRLAAVEASRGSFEEAAGAVERATATRVGKRQVEELAARSAADVEAFYEAVGREGAEDGDVLVISADGKGIVMRPGSLRAATERAAAGATTKLKGRLSKGEKPNRKRMATVGAVYDLAPEPRTATDVLASDRDKPSAPRAKAKWLTASVAEDAAEVVGRVFDEAQRRDPGQQRRWVALVDGNNHQIDRIQAEAARRKVSVAVVVDLIHVLEHLWGAAWCFFREGDSAAEAWVHDRALAVLEGRVGDVAAGIRRRATTAGLAATKRKKADDAARYLTNKAPYLDYPTALAAGWPIATGVIEGACRHLVKDRMDITGARWSVVGAEAVLKLRAVRCNGDFDAYWRFHLDQERHRVHESRYADGAIPTTA
ncbi:MAG TPA: ISKra4 family transposase [Acidimicrobiales bacterium]|nr:ISKra4 family transposase [Acidimicrobiales bacterium]